ncbi:MAG: transposase [Candidatus Azotimanducaceae bacterium]
MGLHGSKLYDWRRKLREQASTSLIERDQAAEIAQLKRQLAEQAEELAIAKKAATYFVKNLK